MQKLRPDMDIGHNIQRLRKASNMTQDQVIARLQLMGIEISKSTYAKDWCRPSGSPSAIYRSVDRFTPVHRRSVQIHISLEKSNRSSPA